MFFAVSFRIDEYFFYMPNVGKQSSHPLSGFQMATVQIMMPCMQVCEYARCANPITDPNEEAS
jgi:hypothetical protein